jgi:hypothetical protein
MKIYEILGEMTSAGGMASVASPLGGGDPAASIYTKKKKSKKTDEMFSTRSLGLKGASKRSRDKARDKDKDKDKDTEQTKTKTTMIRR